MKMRHRIIIGDSRNMSNIQDKSIVSLINCAELWLQDAIVIAEEIRVLWEICFPDSASIYGGSGKNVKIPLKQTIALIPATTLPNEQDIISQLFF